MMESSIAKDEIIPFLRKRDYRLVKELGQGACGKTVLLHDEQIDELFVCKKYCPRSNVYRQEYFGKFVREIKLLYKIHHQNIVRIFNCYLYPEKYSGYILMEFVDGMDINKYLQQFPEQINEIFIQAVDGFKYLETIGILHRDIRPFNIMIREARTSSSA